MDLEQLCSVLQACISPDPEARKAGELALQQSEKQIGQIVSLLRVAVEDRVDPGVRQVAAISFKNLVKRHWEANEAAKIGQEYVVPDSDKAIVRDNLLESMIRAPHMVQVQLGESMKDVLHCDYPQKWTNLLPSLVQNLQSNDQQRTFGALFALRIMTRKYQFRDEEEKSPLTTIVDATFPYLLNLLNAVNADTTGDLRMAEAGRQVLKTFYYATFMEAAPQLTDPNTFLAWMGALHTTITKPTFETGMPVVDDEGRRKWPWWKLKKTAFRIAYRHLSRYSSTVDLSGTELAFAQLYMDQAMLKFVEANLGIMALIANGQGVSPQVVSLALQSLTHAVQNKACYPALKPHADDLLINVVFPLMCHNLEDARLWEEDPQEYIRRGYDFLENPYDIKMSSVNFAHQLCMRPKGTHMQRFMGHLLGVLNKFAAERAAGNVTPVTTQQMDGALMAIGSLSNILHKKKPYKQQLETMLMTHIAPTMEVPMGHLRAKACWVVGEFADIEFAGGNEESKGPNFAALFRAVVAGLRDPELPVRVDAGASLRYFIEELPDGNPLCPILPQLLDGVFTLMSEVDNEELVSTLETIIEKVGEQIAPYAVELAQRLVAAFSQYAERDDDADDESFQAEWAAYGCLRALNTLLGNLSELQHVFPAMEEAIFPLMQRLISNDGQDLLEEVLELLTYFTYLSPTISPRLWSLWPQIHQVVVEWGVDYWEHVLRPLDNFISRGNDVFLSGSPIDYLASAFKMVETSFTSGTQEPNLVSAAQLLIVILQNCRGRIDQYLEPYLAITLRSLATAETRGLRDSLLLVVTNALYYNTPLALAALQHHAATASVFTTWFQMIFAQNPVGGMKHFKYTHEKRMVALGLNAVLLLPDEQLPVELKTGLHQIASGLLHVLTALKEQLAEIARSKDADDDDAPAANDSDDEGDIDDLDDAGDEEDEEYIKKLRKAAADFISGKDDDSDDEFSDGDDDVCFPTDEIDVFQEFANTLRGMQAGNPGRYQALEAALEGRLAASVETLLQPVAATS